MRTLTERRRCVVCFHRDCARLVSDNRNIIVDRQWHALMYLYFMVLCRVFVATACYCRILGLFMRILNSDIEWVGFGEVDPATMEHCWYGLNGFGNWFALFCCLYALSIWIHTFMDDCPNSISSSVVLTP